MTEIKFVRDFDARVFEMLAKMKIQEMPRGKAYLPFSSKLEFVQKLRTLLEGGWKQ